MLNFLKNIYAIVEKETHFFHLQSTARHQNFSWVFPELAKQLAVQTSSRRVKIISRPWQPFVTIKSKYQSPSCTSQFCHCSTILSKLKTRCKHKLWWRQLPPKSPESEIKWIRGGDLYLRFMAFANGCYHSGRVIPSCHICLYKM